MQTAQKNPQNAKNIKSQVGKALSDTQKEQKEQEQNLSNDCYEFLASSADCKLIKQLDLEAFFADFATFLARKKPMYLNGDLAVYKKMIDELDLAFCDSIHLPQIPRVDLLEPALMHLNKNGNLHLSQIYNISKILGYFCTLQKHIQKNSQIPDKSTLKEWIEKIIFPPNLLESLLIFTQNGEIKDGIFPQIDSIKSSISNVASSIKSELSALLNSKHLESYLVDKQVHFIYECQTLLLKAGFSKALNGNILERTQSGYFYVLPSAIARLYERQNSLRDSLEVEIANIAKNLSILLKKHILFLRFIDKEFDKFDLLQARLNFAKSKNLEFILPYVASQNPKKAKQAKDISSFYGDSLKIILHDFCHPILANPKPTNIIFDKGALILTGVNAGGKTMLLKSILSAVFLAKLLMPMKINPHKSRIPHFRQITAIISDPQNTKNDISTFAGRMLEFSQNLGRENMLLGIDEIELGTDADEASSLYQILLDEILKRGNKIVLTTHHKRLASLMAGDFRVQMSAALFDVNLGKPLFEFLHGSIGKSYAFESAERYGIPTLLVERARKHYGEDKERLNELIEQSSKLEIELKSKQEQAQKELENLQKKSAQYDELIISLKEKFAKKEMVMERSYKEALDILKQKANTMSEAHRNINTAHKILESFYAQDDESRENAGHTKAHTTNATNQKSSYKKGDTIKYNGKRGKILEIHSKHFLVELDSGMRLKVDFAKANEKSHSNLLPTHKLQKDSSKSVATKGYTLELAHSGASPSLDLHGFRVEEAIEAMEDFISQSLVAGFDEVAICHGLGGGVLARVTREFLSTHPKVVSFCDAPPKLGGMGTQIVRL